MVAKAATGGRPGRFASACLSTLLLSGAWQPVQAQRRPAAPQPTAAAPAQSSAVAVPDRLTTLKMLWSIMAAIDHANRTGNYSVLRDLGSAGFQANNNPANLAAIFAGLRNQQLDLSDTLIVSPTWEIAPTMVRPTVLRMRGSFPLRPQAIGFDLLFAWERGWRLDGVGVVPLPAQR